MSYINITVFLWISQNHDPTLHILFGQQYPLQGAHSEDRYNTSGKKLNHINYHTAVSWSPSGDQSSVALYNLFLKNRQISLISTLKIQITNIQYFKIQLKIQLKNTCEGKLLTFPDNTINKKNSCNEQYGLISSHIQTYIQTTSGGGARSTVEFTQMLRKKSVQIEIVSAGAISQAQQGLFLELCASASRLQRPQ